MSAIPITNPLIFPAGTTFRQAPPEPVAAKGMYTQEMVINPAMAERWLQGNVNNRKLNPGTVARYAEDMTSGHWKRTHQGIAISNTGRLLDGQHRLSAIVKAGVTVRMSVTFNMPGDAMLVVDQNRPRQLGEQLTLEGGFGHVSHTHIAILRAMVAGLSMTNMKRTATEERDLLRTHFAAVKFAHDVLPGATADITASVRACFGRAFYTIDHDAIRRFVTALASRIAPADGGGVAIGLLLKSFAANGRSRHTPAGRAECYGRTCRALLAYVKGETITKLYTPTAEIFPLPEIEPVESPAAASARAYADLDCPE